MTHVYTLWFNPLGEEDARLIGVFTTRTKAKNETKFLNRTVGVSVSQFEIERHELDKLAFK